MRLVAALPRPLVDLLPGVSLPAALTGPPPDPAAEPVAVPARPGRASAAELGALMLGVAAGEPQAFVDLYAATATPVHGVAYRVLHCPEHAADVTQEVFLQVWQQAVRYDPGRGAVLPWLLTLTHRRAVDRVRRLVSATASNQRYVARNHTRDTDLVSEDVLAREDARALRAALDQLSAVQREAVTLAYLGGRTAPEIAALLGVPLGTVKTRIRNGVAALRRVVDQSLPPTTATP